MTTPGCRGKGGLRGNVPELIGTNDRALDESGVLRRVRLFVLRTAVYFFSIMEAFLFCFVSLHATGGAASLTFLVRRAGGAERGRWAAGRLGGREGTPRTDWGAGMKRVKCAAVFGVRLHQGIFVWSPAHTPSAHIATPVESRNIVTTEAIG